MRLARISRPFGRVVAEQTLDELSDSARLQIFVPPEFRIHNLSCLLMGNKVAEHLNISTEKYRKLVISTINQ